MASFESDFKSFLATIDLDEYRKRFVQMKIVEMDLPKEIWALKTIYGTYWEKRDFLNFDQFYDIYQAALGDQIEAFRTKIQMCEGCFYKGLPARQYRTWASLLTQIHAGAVAEDFFQEAEVVMCEELDRKGVDFQVRFPRGDVLDFQVKKNSARKEAQQVAGRKKKNPIIDIFYTVPAAEIFVNPKKRNGEFRKPYLDFQNQKIVERLDNGFIVFTSAVFEAWSKDGVPNSGA